jgi:hypothetical protein
MSERPIVDFTSIISESDIPITEAEFEELLKKEVIGAGSSLSSDSAMSPFWRWVKAAVITPALWLINVLLAQYIMPNMFVATAQRWALELKAWELNVAIKSAVKTQGLITLTKQNSADAVTIAQGTIIQTLPIDGVTYKVQVLAETVIEVGFETGTVLVEALEAGLAYNLAAGYFNILPEELPGIISVTNEPDWITTLGANAETDEELALRLQNAFTSAGNWHIDDAYRSIISSVAGIRSDNVFFENTGHISPGSANAYIVMEVGATPQSILDSLNEYIMIKGFHGHGDVVNCLAIPDQFYDLAVEIVFIDNTSEDKIKLNLVEVENRIRSAFRETEAFANITRAKPLSRFSISLLCTELHQQMNAVQSVKIRINNNIQEDILSGLQQPRINSLTVIEALS